MVIYNSGISGSGVRKMQSGTIGSGTTASSVIGTMNLSLDVASRKHYKSGTNPKTGASYNITLDGITVTDSTYTQNNASSVIYTIPLSGFSKTNKMSITIEPLTTSSLSDSFTVNAEASRSSGYAFKYIVYGSDSNRGKLTDAIEMCPYNTSVSLSSITYGLSNPNQLYISIPYSTSFKSGTARYTGTSITNPKEWYTDYFYDKAFANVVFDDRHTYCVSTDKYGNPVYRSFTVDDLGAATVPNGTVSSQFIMTAKTTGTIKYTVIEYY